MALQPFTREQLNYFKFASIFLDEFPKALRQTFVLMWNNTYGHLPGHQVWDDSPVVRNLLLAAEGGATKIPTNTSINDWDCTALFQATIFARSFASLDSAGHRRSLSDLYVKPRRLPRGMFHPSVISPSGNVAETFALAIDQLRLLRNKLCHSAHPMIDTAKFHQYVQQAKEAFTALGVNTVFIDAIGSLTELDFPAPRVQQLVETINSERQALIKFLEEDGTDEMRAMRTDITESGRQRQEEPMEAVGELKKLQMQSTDEIKRQFGEMRQEMRQEMRRSFEDLFVLPTTPLTALQRNEEKDDSTKKTKKRRMSKELAGRAKRYLTEKMRKEGASKNTDEDGGGEEQTQTTERTEDQREIEAEGIPQQQLRDHTSTQPALDVQRKLLDEQNISIADSYYSLGVTQLKQGDYTSAIESNKRALEIRRKLLGEEHTKTADSYESLGATQYALGDFTSAVESNKRALEIRRKLFGEEHTKTADSYASLGATQYTLGDFTSAVESNKRALEIRRKLFGEEHTKTADSYASLGATQYTLGDFTSAVESNKRALEIRRKLLGEVHTKTADNMFTFTLAGIPANVLPREDKAQQAYDTALEDVPPEIRARGPRAELAYQKALRNGKVQVYRGRIMLIGQDRAGKTSLKKSLLGLPFDPREESTVGVEIDPSKFEVDVDQVKNWQRTDEKKLCETAEYKDGIARMMAAELNSNDTGEEESSVVGQERTNSSVEQVVDEDDKETTMEKSVVHPTAGMALEKTSQEDKDDIKGPRGKSTEQSELTNLQAVIDSAAALPDDVTEHVIQYLQHQKLEDDVKAKETILTLWDFAGQHLYYASHSVFLSPRAVYILVYNLSKELSATAEPCVRQGIHDVRLENPNGETNMDSLLSWLVSVHSIQSSRGGEGVENDPDSRVAKLPYLRPPVLIVGTNADRPFEDAKKMESRVKKSISGKTYEKHVIRPLFSVDNSRAVTDAGLCALRKEIINVLKQEPYMGEEVPIRWFNFEKVVEALVAKKTFHMNLDQLLDVIRQVCFIQDGDELAAMLNFYHDLGVIVKHGRTVVLQAQWLIDLFKKLITVRPFDEVDPVCAGYWGELEKSGILRMELVDHVFADLIQQGLGKQDILDMMELYGLIAKFSPSSTDMYFVPAQLTSSPKELSKIRHSDSDPCPLYFHFLDGFVPHGLFTQIVSRCIRWCSDHGPKRAPNLFHNGARFFLGKQTIYDLIVICRKQFIKIVLKQRKTPALVSSDALAEMAVQVREFLEETLQGLSRDLPWLRHLRYELCVACPSCLGAEEKCVAHELVSCTHDDCLHLIRLMPEEQPICEKRFGDKTPAVCGLEKWYKLDPKDPDAVQPQKSVQMDQAPHSVELCNRRPLPTLEVKKGTPSDTELETVAVKTVKVWQNLGRRLGFDDEELTAFHIQNEKCSEKSYQMLLCWKGRNGNDATYQALNVALRHKLVGRQDLAIQFCCDKGIPQQELLDYTSTQPALDVQRQLLDEQKKTTADTCYSLALSQYKMGDFTSAVESHKRALEIRRKLLGEEHVDTAKSYESLGATQLALGDHSSAFETFKRLSDIKRKLLGEKHRDGEQLS